MLGVKSQYFGLQNGMTYDEEYIKQSCRRIALAIEARAEHFPHEVPFDYAPLRGERGEGRYDTKEGRAAVLRKYYRYNLNI